LRESLRDYIAPKVPYVAMRMLCGLMGAAVVPMAFFTIKNSGHSLHAAVLAAVLVLFGKVSNKLFFAARFRDNHRTKKLTSSCFITMHACIP